MSGTIRSAGQCYYSTPEYASSFRGKYIWLFEGKGTLRLTTTFLALENSPLALYIPLPAIKSINIKFFSRWAKPIPWAYFDVKYLSDGHEKTIRLNPYDCLTVWDSNKLIESWITTFEHVDELKGRIKPPLRPLCTSPTPIQMAVMGIALVLPLGLCLFLFWLLLETLLTSPFSFLPPSLPSLLP